MKLTLATEIHAPIDLIWELFCEGDEGDKCIFTGFEFGKVIEEYEDGVLRYIKKAEHIIKEKRQLSDEPYCFNAHFTGNEGHEIKVLKELDDIGHHITRLHSIYEWNTPTSDKIPEKNYKIIFEKRLKNFKTHVETLWAENESFSKTNTESTMH